MQSSQRNPRTGQTSHSQKKLAKQVVQNPKPKTQKPPKELAKPQKDPKKTNSNPIQPKPKQAPSRPQIDSLIPGQRPFDPFVTKTLEVEGKGGISYMAVAYNQEHNLLIACPRVNFMRFYDATTLLPVNEIKPERLESPAMVMSFSPETDTYVLGCMHGYIYTYNISNKVLKIAHRVLVLGQGHLIAMAFVDPIHYGFSAPPSQKLCIGNLENGGLLSFDLNGSSSGYLENWPEKKLLFSGMKNGSVVIYRTDRLPRLPALGSAGNRDNSGISRKILIVKINGKELVITSGSEGRIEIRHLSRGKMRLIKMIPLKEPVMKMVYLEDYKIIAATHPDMAVRFYKLPFGKLEGKVDLDMAKCYAIFWMKDKNCIGVPSSLINKIKIISLHGGEEAKEMKKKAVSRLYAKKR